MNQNLDQIRKIHLTLIVVCAACLVLALGPKKNQRIENGIIELDLLDDYLKSDFKEFRTFGEKYAKKYSADRKILDNLKINLTSHKNLINPLVFKIKEHTKKSSNNVKVILEPGVKVPKISNELTMNEIHKKLWFGMLSQPNLFYYQDYLDSLNDLYLKPIFESKTFYDDNNISENDTISIILYSIITDNENLFLGFKIHNNDHSFYINGTKVFPNKVQFGYPVFYNDSMKKHSIEFINFAKQSTKYNSLYSKEDILLPTLRSYFWKDIQYLSLQEASSKMREYRQSSNEYISVVGITFNKNTFYVGGPVLIFVILLFLNSHIRQLNSRTKKDFDIIWVGLFRNYLARLIVFFSLMLLPIISSALLLHQFNGRYSDILIYISVISFIIVGFNTLLQTNKLRTQV